MGGSNCAVVGCGCCSSRHKGVSFHTFPKSGRNNETDEWRRRLINAVCRADKSFNPDTETGLLIVPVFCPGFQKGRVPSEKGTLARRTDRQKGTLAR